MSNLAETKAIELWKRCLNRRGFPYAIESLGMERCFFCDKYAGIHAENCIYIAAKELVSLDEKDELG